MKEFLVALIVAVVLVFIGYAVVRTSQDCRERGGVLTRDGYCLKEVK